MKQKFLLCILAVLLTSCQRACNRMNKRYQVSKRDYDIVLFSGGDTVFHDNVHTMINDAEGSDGIYYYKHDTLVELSGDYLIKSAK